jgi:small subunit ribosomal protein S18
VSNTRNLDFEDEELDDMDDMDSGDSGRPGGRSVRRRRGQRKEDYFAVNKTVPNYKEVDILRRFITERAKIRPRRQTGLSAKNQRKLAQEIKRARHLALLPFTDAHSRGS